MVVAYLENIREKFQNEIISANSELSNLHFLLKENVEIIKLLESNVDRNYEGFTPRQVDGFNLRKINELKIEQDELKKKICLLNENIFSLNVELKKVTDVIIVAKENDKIIEKLVERD